MLDQPHLQEPGQPTVSPPASGARPPGPTPEWPEPDLCLLHGWRDHLPPFPVDTLPKAWRAWAARAASGANASVDHVALSLLTVAASQIGHSRRVAPVPSWSEPCILWTALVGPPSSGKTPAMDTALKMVRAIERRPASNRDEIWRQLREEHERKVAQFGEEARRALPNGTRMPRGPGPEPDPPPLPEPLTASDATLDVLVDALQRSSRGVLLPCDERSDWLDRMVRDDSERAFWLSAWSGRPFLIEGRGRPAVALPRPAISILGTLEPDAITPALASGGDDRVISRFLFAWSERPLLQPLSEMAEGTRPEEREALNRLCQMSDTPRTLALEPEALPAFDAFRRAHDAEAGKLDGRESAWWGKGPGTVLRLAGTLTFLAWAIKEPGTAEPAQVPAWTIKAAARLWQHFLWPHARTVFGTAGNSRSESRGQKVLRWLKREGKSEISRTELRRSALSGSCNAAESTRVAELLVTGGWLHPREPERKPMGRPTTRWSVNPVLHGATNA
jgi:hypothetical protein